MTEQDKPNQDPAEQLEEMIEEEADVTIESVEDEGDAPSDKPKSRKEKKADKKMETLQAEYDELYERLQRVSADYQNYMRRTAQEEQKQIKLAKGSVIRSFFPVIDHFDNALEKEPIDDEAKALYEGVKIVRDEFLRVMQISGVQQITPRVGDAFDPEKHEAMLHQLVEGVGPNCVSIVFQPGYVMGDRTLRPAKVAVSPADAPEVELEIDDPNERFDAGGADDADV